MTNKFTKEEIDFLVNYCNKHIADCEEMTYCCSKETCESLGVYKNMRWYKNIKNKLLNLEVEND